MEENREAGNREEGGGRSGVLLSQEYLRRRFLSTNNPLEFVEEIQQNHAPRLRNCEPVIGLLEVAGFKRFSLYRALYENLKEALVREVRNAPRESLLRLLLETLPFLAFPPLADVPTSILGAVPNPPNLVLERLSTMDQSVFEKLPRHIRQQVWERYPSTFQAHVHGLIEKYLVDGSSITWSEEMHPDGQYPAPHKRRQRNAPLQEIVHAIGSSPRLYRFFVDEIRDRFRKSNNVRYCALRADILMAMHDISANTILKTDPCHAFAHYLDSMVKNVCIFTAAGTMDMKTAQREKSIMNELLKLMNKAYKPDLVSAFAIDDEVGNPSAKAAAIGSSGPMKSKSRASLPGPKKTIDLTTALLEALNKIRASDRNRVFHQPVVETYPSLEKQYLAAIKTPMDLQTIEEKIRKGKYNSVDDMRLDLQLIAINAKTFNGEKSDISKLADRLMRLKAQTYLNKASSMLEHARMEKAAEENRRAEQKRLQEQQAESLQEEEAKASKAKLSDEELEKKRAEAEEEQRIKDWAEENERLVFEESNTRNARCLGDAAMILASGFTVNALTNTLLFLMGEEIIKGEILPRDAELTRNVSWFLEVAGSAHEFVSAAQRGETVSFRDLTPTFEKEFLPSLANMLLDTVEFRSGKVSSEENANDGLDKNLVAWCKENWVIRNTMLHFFCDLICHRDLSLILPVFEVIKQLETAATDHPGFLHSLVTSFYISSTSKPKESSQIPNKSHKRSPLNASGSRGAQLPPLPPNFLVDVVKSLFLPAVYQTAPLETPSFNTERQHSHLSRLINLDLFQHGISQTELLNFLRSAILSLAGLSKEDDPLHVLGSPELKDLISKRYCDPGFHRAQRQYEKIFRKFPNFRTQCGLLPLMNGQRGPGLPSPSPSPSPFITPSPSPSPVNPSPFHTSSPAAAESAYSPPPYKRPLDQLLERRASDEPSESSKRSRQYE